MDFIALSRKLNKFEKQFAAGKISYSELVEKGNKELDDIEKSCRHRTTETETNENGKKVKVCTDKCLKELT